MKTILKSIAALAVLAISGTLISSVFTTNAEGGYGRGFNRQNRGPAEAAWEEIVIDVACDYNTEKLVGVGDDGNPVRGTTFIVDGKIYPANTLPDGPWDPADPAAFDIETDGDIGTWHCRGTYNFDLSEILEGKQPHVATIQHYYFGDSGDMLAPDSLRSEGMEGADHAPFVTRVVYGGTGEYRAVIGEVKQETLGINNTGYFNFRFTFKVRRGA